MEFKKKTSSINDKSLETIKSRKGLNSQKMALSFNIVNSNNNFFLYCKSSPKNKIKINFKNRWRCRFKHNHYIYETVKGRTNMFSHDDREHLMTETFRHKSNSEIIPYHPHHFLMKHLSHPHCHPHKLW